MADPEDEALALRLREGDREALGELASRWQDRLYRIAWLHCGHPDDAADLVQEILIAVWESIRGYRPGTRFDAWLMRLAANRAVSWRRKRLVRRATPLEAAEGVGAGTPAPSVRIALEERRLKVQRALASLGERERLCLILRTVEGWTPAQIGTTLGLQPASVSVTLSRARASLRERCQAEGIGEEDLTG